MNKSQQPSVPLTRFDKLVETIGWSLIAAMWLLAVYGYSILPSSIPVHFDEDGNINGYGSKATMLILPLFTTVIFILITALNKYPHIFNYPVTITEANRQFQYQVATRMLRCLKLAIALIFVIIIFDLYLSAIKKTSVMGTWLLLFIIAVINVPVIYFISRMFAKPAIKK